MTEKKTVYRRSDTGTFTTRQYAEKHKSTTERQRVPAPTRKKGT